MRPTIAAQRKQQVLPVHRVVHGNRAVAVEGDDRLSSKNNRMLRIVAGALACVMLLGANEPPTRVRSAFHILGASVDVQVARHGDVLPAGLVPSLEPGDTIEISFPKGVQFSRSPRWHLVVANMYDDYLQHAPTFPIADADLSRRKPGYVWRVPYDGTATPIVFLVPENGNRYGHGIPDARIAIDDLKNRALLLHTATLSASAEAKETFLHSLFVSMASAQPSDLPDVRARIQAAAQAITAGYASPPQANIAAALTSQFTIGAATYGMLIGAVYELLAKRRVMAHYIFVPGVIRPGSASSTVYVNQQPEYDPSARRPSTIVYFEIGSKDTNPQAPAYGSAPAMPFCLTGNALDVAMPFTGSPIYFRSHDLRVKAASTAFDVTATYDPVLGYRATLSSAEVGSLKNGGTATISSLWGFGRFNSEPFDIVEPRPANWHLQTSGPVDLVSGEPAQTLTFTDAGAGMGSCVQSVTVRDGLGRVIPVVKLDRTKDSVTATLDASAAGGAAGSAAVDEGDSIASAPLSFSIFPAMPSIASAIAYLPKGILVLHGKNLKYIDTVTLNNTGITFARGTPNADGSWTFTSEKPATYEPAWEHETMVISLTLEPPDPRTEAVEADAEYAP
jgi:hypothetical protein